MGQQTNKTKPIKHICAGLLAHVDAGKTTLSEGLLYTSGQLRRLGRVDHGDAFLDTDAQERERGITIFSKQAVLPLESMTITLLDTPGHVDFSSEMERTLQVLDYAILVISGTDGVQGHTLTLWRLLSRYHIPTFLFINKMDLAGADRGGRRRVRRGHFGKIPGDGGFGGPRRDLPHPAPEGVPLLVRLRPEAGGGDRVSPGGGAVRRPAPLPPGVRREGL